MFKVVLKLSFLTQSWGNDQFDLTLYIDLPYSIVLPLSSLKLLCKLSLLHRILPYNCHKFFERNIACRTCVCFSYHFTDITLRNRFTQRHHDRLQVIKRNKPIIVWSWLWYKPRHFYSPKSNCLKISFISELDIASLVWILYYYRPDRNGYHNWQKLAEIDLANFFVLKQFSVIFPRHWPVHTFQNFIQRLFGLRILYDHQDKSFF